MAFRLKVLPSLAAGVFSLSTILTAQTYPPSVGQMVAKVKAEVKAVNMADFKAVYDKKETGLLVDARNENEFEEGHIPGAVNVPRGLVEFRIWKLVGFPDKTDLNTKITIYCATGGRSALATKSLRDLGFTNVTAVDLKFEDWKKAGYPVEE
jgi:rhodanese-related sulfurtransferase